MRKKLVALALVLILALTFVLSACGEDGLIRKNAERDIKQITATATYNGRITLIDKAELNSSINQYLSTLVQYYSNGYISADQYYAAIEDMGKNYDSANENLGKSALFTLYCLDYVAESYKNDAEKYAAITAASTKGKTYDTSNHAENKRFYADRIAEIEAILTTEQLNDVRKELNEEFDSQLESFRKEVTEEIELANKEEEPEVPEGAVSINVTLPTKLIYEVGEEIDTEGLVVQAVYEDETTFDLTEDDYELSGFDSSKIKSSVEVTVTYKELKKTFNVQIVEARPTRPQKEVEEEEEPYPTDGEGKIILLDKFDFTVLREDYEDRDEYSIDVEAMRRVTENLEESYRDYDYYYYTKLNSKIVSVCQELIQSSVKVTQSDLQNFYDLELNKQMEGYLSKEYAAETLENAPYNTIAHAVSEDGSGYYYVKHILFKFNTAQTEALKRYADEKTGNDAALKALREQYADLIGVWLSNPIYDEEADPEDEDFVEDSDKKYLNDTAINVLEVIEDIEDDLNAIKNNPEFATEAERNRALMEKFDEWIYKANEDDGMFDTLSKDGLGYLVPPEGIESGYVPEFEELCHTLAAQGVGAGNWCVTEYGIHYIIVTGYASDAAHEPDAEYVNLPFNYIVNGLTYEKITSGDEYKLYTTETEFNYIDKGTLAQYIYDTVYSNKKSDIFASFQKEFYNDYTDSNIEYYPKTYKNTVKELQDNLNR